MKPVSVRGAWVNPALRDDVRMLVSKWGLADVVKAILIMSREEVQRVGNSAQFSYRIAQAAIEQIVGRTLKSRGAGRP